MILINNSANKNAPTKEEIFNHNKSVLLHMDKNSHTIINIPIIHEANN